MFSQATLPLLAASTHLAHPPTLIFTGATGSIKASPNSATFASGKFATRALSQSLAKEYGPQGVHVSHAIIDGVIDIPRTKGYLSDTPEAKISADAVSFCGVLWRLSTDGCRLRMRIGIFIRSRGRRLRGRLILDRMLRSGKVWVDSCYLFVMHR